MSGVPLWDSCPVAQRTELGSPLPPMCCFMWDLRREGEGSFALFPTCPWAPNFRKGCERSPLHALGLIRLSLSPWGTSNVRETVPAGKGAVCPAAARRGPWSRVPHEAVTQVAVCSTPP